MSYSDYFIMQYENLLLALLRMRKRYSSISLFVTLAGALIHSAIVMFASLKACRMPFAPQSQVPPSLVIMAMRFQP